MWKLLLACVAAGALIYGCGSADEHDASIGDGGSAGEAGASGPGVQGGGKAPKATGGSNADAGGEPDGGSPSSSLSGGVSSGGAGNEAGARATEAEGGAGGAGGAAPVVLPDGIIADQPYTCDDTGPFAGVEFDSYFYLENWEDHMLNTPGVTASSSTLSSSFGSGLVDSVDCDDGVVDGSCSTCDALWAPGTVEVDFDAQVLGELPTHVGMVWTDGGFDCDVTVTGYDADDVLIYTQTVSGIGDESNSGTTAEDRFFGIVHYAGVKRVVLSNTGGGIEIDHLQYGR